MLGEGRQSSLCDVGPGSQVAKGLSVDSVVGWRHSNSNQVIKTF